MKVLVCGGRDYVDTFRIWTYLSNEIEWGEHDFLIHGGAKGADTIAGQWAREGGIHEVVVPALWDVFGKSAGWKRNRAMLKLDPSFVVAFPGGRGTADMVKQARAALVDVREVK